MSASLALDPPLGGIAPLPLIALVARASIPWAIRGAHPALSPTFGAPAMPGVWQVLQTCAKSGGAAVDYDVEVCRDHGDSLRFDVKRFEHGKKGSAVQHVKVSSKLASGTRTVVGTIAHGKEATEIAATVR